MEENTELEEGEAWYCEEDDHYGYNKEDESNMDPDVALSYMDEKIQNVLGHFQKDFEGGVSAENLGAKFGGYGSFLPTYERPKTLQGSSCKPRSSNNMPLEGDSQSLTVPSKAPSHVKLGAASDSASGQHSSAAASRDVSGKLCSSLSSVLAPISTVSNENLHKSGSVSDRRTLKVRIKVGSDNRVVKKVTTYSSRGPDNSPSSSWGNSLEGSGGVLPISKTIAGDSPTSILQVMTSFPVPGCVFISPLHDSLLCLMGREESFSMSRPVPGKEGSQKLSFLPRNRPASALGNLKLPKEKAKKLGKSKKNTEVKQGSTTFEKGIAFEKNIENSTAEGNGVKHRCPFGELVKEGSFGPIVGEDNDRNKQINSGSYSAEKVLELRAVEREEDAHLGLRNIGKCKTRETSASPKADSNVFKCNGNVDGGSVTPPKLKVRQQATSHVQDEATMSSAKEKILFGGKKKPQGIRRNKNAAVISTKEYLRVSGSSESKDTTSGQHGVSTTKDKMHKPKLQKDISKVRDNHRGSLDSKMDQLASWERLSADGARDCCSDDFTREQSVSCGRLKEKFSGRRVDSSSIPLHLAKDDLDKGPIKNAAKGGPSVTENAFTSGVVQPVLTQDWVQCDDCEKWRLLYCCKKTEELPEKWRCSMQDWLPGMNRCHVSKEETDIATTELNQQYYLENHGNGSASGACVQLLEHNHQTLDYHAVSCLGKKNSRSKETAKAGRSHGTIQMLTSTKESVNGRSFNDMSNPPVDPSALGTSRLNNSSKSHSLVVGKKAVKLEDHTDGGTRVQPMRKKNKREADHYGYCSSKKIKREDLFCVDKHQDSNSGLGMLDPDLKTNSASKSSGKNMQKSGKHLEDRKCYTREGQAISARRFGDQAGVSSDGDYLGTRTGDGGNDFVKKRRLLECQDNDNRHSSDILLEESSESGSKKAKKSRAPKIATKGSVIENANDNINQNGKVANYFLSSSKDDQADGTESQRVFNKDEQPAKHRSKVVNRKTLDGTNSLRKDCGSGQVSKTVTTSSSKLSCSLKSRTVLDDMKGSPVESVSSSTLRPPIPEKRTSSANIVNDDLPVASNLRRCWDRECDVEVDRSGTEQKDKVSGDSHPDDLTFSASDCLDQYAKQRSTVKDKSSSGWLNGDGDQYHNSSSDYLQNCHEVYRLDKKCVEKAIFPESGKSLSLLSKDQERNSTSDFDKGKVKVFNPVREQDERCLMKMVRTESESDQKSQAPKRINLVKNDFHVSSAMSSKDEKVHTRRSDAEGQSSKDGRMVNELKLEECDDSDTKLGAICSRDNNAGPKLNTIQDFEIDNKVDPIQKALRSGTPNTFSPCGGKGKREGPGCMILKGKMFDKIPAHVKDLDVSTPRRMNTSSQTASDALKDANKLRDSAERFKSGGFPVESNETYFRAALKFLLGACLLESFNGDGSKQGEMNQMQAYKTAAKLSKDCAIEFESRSELAATALAYKCMEVACWRIAYCKNPISTRDLTELRTSLQMIPQGESPSSSASDVDNLNNQATVDKIILPRGTVSHIAGNAVFSARNHSKVLRVLDFTQDASSALEASRKSQDAFSAANIASEEAQIRASIVSVKKVIDFSFQDVQGFIRMVELAMEAISRYRD